MSRKILVTGSSGLIGSEVCAYFARLGFAVHGLDNDQRAVFFGPQGDTRWNQRRLEASLPGFTHHELDIRNRNGVRDLVKAVKPSLVVHSAGQPSHDLAATMPFDDYDTNAVGTLNLLEACRNHAAEAVFVLMSTNKVYGDAPNTLPLVELETRWDFDDEHRTHGIPESFRVDQCLHSLFGASKLSADVLVQEYGRYFNMPTCALRAGCMTGGNHSGVELHGFLSYLIRCNVEGKEYSVFGHKGKQVRDNLHSADVAAFIHQFYMAPRSGEVYNLGGGKQNSCSILEAFDLAEKVTGRKQRYTYLEQPRRGDHVCYYSDLRKAMSHYPSWMVTRNLPWIFRDIAQSWEARLSAVEPIIAP